MSEEQQQAQPEAEPRPQETAQPEAGETEEGQEAKPEAKPPRAEKRISKLTFEREEARREAEYWKRQAMEVKKEEVQAPAAPTGKPKPEDFTDAAEYFEAVAEYKANEIIARRDTKAAEERTRTQAQEVQTGYQQRAEAARAKYQDFDDVVTDEIPASPAMLEVIVRSEIGPEIAYYLGNHPDEAARISKLAPLDAARALGRIEDRLDVKEATKPAVSQAPPPIKPVSRSTKSETDPDDMSPKEWLAWRNKQIAEARKRR